MRWGALSAAATALLSLGALLTALTVTPLGDAIRDRVFDEESGYCGAPLGLVVKVIAGGR